MRRDELINRTLLVILGVLVGLLVFLFRTETPTVQSLELIEFQYFVIFLLLGLLPMLRLKATTPAGRAVMEFLTIVILVVVALQPIDLIVNTLTALTVFLGSLAYFRFYRGGLQYLILFLTLPLFETYLYAVITLWLWFEETDDFRFLLGIILLTVVLIAVGRMLYQEYGNIA